MIIRGRHIDNGLIVSATAHVAVLLWAGISFAAKPYIVPPVDTVEVDVLSANELSQMTAGSKTAPKKDVPKKLVEKKAPPKAVEHPEAKIAEKEIVTASAAPEAPKEAKPPEPKPEPKPPEVKPVPQVKAQVKPKPPEKVIPDAESLQKSEKKKEEPKKEEVKKEEPKKEPPKKEVVKHEPPKKPEPKPHPKVVQHKTDAPKLDFDHIAALLDKRQPQRLASAGDVINNAPSLGTTTGTSQTLSQSELDALRARIEACWQLPPGGLETSDLRVDIHVRFNQDGSLAEPPRLLTRTNSPYHSAVASSAMRAIERCAPYTFLPVAKFQVWKEIEMGFDPRDRARG